MASEALTITAALVISENYVGAESGMLMDRYLSIAPTTAKSAMPAKSAIAAG
jgi:hypothetical protein